MESAPTDPPERLSAEEIDGLEWFAAQVGISTEEACRDVLRRR